MKKFILTLALIAVAFSVKAQAPVPANWGIRAGLTLTTYSSNTYELSTISNPLQPGFYIGGFADWEKVVGNFGVSIEADFTTMGQRGKDSATGIIYSRTGYHLLIPAIAKYGFLDGRLHVGVGPQLGICFGGKDKTRSGNSTAYVNWDKSDFNVFDFAFVFSADFMITTKIGVEARYNLGLTNNFRNVGSANRGLEFGVFYQF